MDMDRSCVRSCTLTSLHSVLMITITTITSALVQLLSWLHLIALLCPTFIIAGAQYSNDPSTNWSLSDYLPNGFSNKVIGSMTKSTQGFSSFKFSRFVACNNGSYLELLSDETGLYGRSPYNMYIDSAHDSESMPYTVSFNFYFVIPAQSICMKENNDTIPAYYLSLVALNAYGRTQDPNKGQVVWTANPDKPVGKNACLIMNDSDIALVDYQDNNRSSPQVVWQISSGASNLSLVITYEGNVVLFNINGGDGIIPVQEPILLWESFQHPTDTLMVLQVLDNDSTLTVNSSSGNYTMAIQNESIVLYANIGQLMDANEDSSSYGSPYWVWPRSNPSVNASHNISFAAFCWDSVNQLRLYAGSNRSSDDSTEYRGMVSPEFCSTIPNDNDTTIPIAAMNSSSMNATYATFLRLEADGDLRAYTVDNTTYPGSSATWGAFYSLFENTPCDLPLYCGFYGMCDPEKTGASYCNCDYNGTKDETMVATGFPETPDPKSGCKLKDGSVGELWDVPNISGSGQASACPTTKNITACVTEESRCDIQFLSVSNVHYFSLDFIKSYQGVNNSNGCLKECEGDCFCSAAFWNEGSGRCYLILGRVGTIQKQGTMQAFLKYVKITSIPSPAAAAPSSGLPSSSGILWKVLGPFIATILLVTCIFLAYWQRRREQKLNELQSERRQMLSDLDCSTIERFTWRQMHEYTCGFSDLMGGGGFGRVFRGALPDCTAIAVKQLDQDGSQGEKEFIAEVSILSRIHHAHLVRLIGFCLERKHRLLVYEYMENGSLDGWLFKSHTHSTMNEKHKGRELLRWKTRFQIALGTAKGLAYLHEECEERVIHMDLKPQNILLGRGFVAKISDFGMFRRTAREQTSVMTVMKGTPGYLAPEWLLDCAITEKCDVYSFGILLLEMVGGSKVKDLRVLRQRLSAQLLRESVILDLLDESLRYDNRDGSDEEEQEAVRMVKVALMCVRRDPRKRPAMSRVALMLEGKEEVVEEVAAADDDDDGDDTQKRELVMDLSAMNRTMRIEQQQQPPPPKEKQEEVMYDTYCSSDSGGGSSTNVWWSPDDNNYIIIRAHSLQDNLHGNGMIHLLRRTTLH